MSLIERQFREKIVLVGVITPESDQDTVEESMDELALLVDTAGADVVARSIQRRDAPDPATFIGKGKAEEIRDLSYQVDSDTVVFDEELSPAQQRNLEKIFGRTAIDRTAVILDIFAQNARTVEGKAQVELALLRYRLPRLRGRGSSLSQQAGGIGTRGPGETQLEVDRRRLMRRITHLEHELKNVAKSRITQRKARQRGRNFAVSLVGYTNAGKSTLLNAITQAGTLTENRLFSTLDPITRRAELPGGERVLFSDTVGFVRKLPHQLVEAFRSTLDEVNDADLLVHVVDASASDPQAQIDAVHAVLSEIETNELPELMVFNKTDRLNSDSQRELTQLMQRYPGSVDVSGLTGRGIENLILTIGSRLRSLQRVVELAVPFDRGDVLAFVHREGEVLVESETDTGMHLRARLDEASVGQLKEFVVNQYESKAE
jgi:GTPase